MLNKLKAESSLATQANVDVISGGVGLGACAKALMEHNFNVNALRTNDTLQKEEWLKFDEKVVEVATKRLVIVGDLMSRGLTYEVENAMGITEIEWEVESDMTDAEISMDGNTMSQNDRVTYASKYLPLPIIHKDFSINARALASSRNRGTPLDTTQVAKATRIVSEKIESLVFNGSSIKSSSKSIPGLLTFANRNTGSVTGTGFDAETGANILADVLAIIETLEGDNMYGPYVLYVPYAAYNNMLNDFKADSDKTILSRLLEIPQLEAIKPSKDLTGDNVIMLQMTEDVIDIVDGIQPTVVSWESNGGMRLHFKVMAIIVPRLKSDDEGQCGIAHYS